MFWCRLWHDMPTDPKWRVIAHRSGRPICEVVAVFTYMLANASSNPAERGRLHGFNADDVAAALDMDEASVEAIMKAMHGKVLYGDLLTGWERRQPLREDDSTNRVRAFRARKAALNDAKRDVTPCNAAKRPREEKIREENSLYGEPDGSPSDTDFTLKDEGYGAAIANGGAFSESSILGEDEQAAATESHCETKPAEKPKRRRSVEISEDWKPSPENVHFALDLGMARAEVEHEAQKFAAWYRSKGERRADWSATWEVWVLNTAKGRTAPATPPSVPAATIAKPADPAAAEKWEDMRAAFGEAALHSWFCKDSRAALCRDADGFVFVVERMKEETISARYGPRLNEIFGGKNWKKTGRGWRFERKNKAA